MEGKTSPEPGVQRHQDVSRRHTGVAGREEEGGNNAFLLSNRNTKETSALSSFMEYTVHCGPFYGLLFPLNCLLYFKNEKNFILNDGKRNLFHIDHTTCKAPDTAPARHGDESKRCPDPNTRGADCLSPGARYATDNKI